MAHSPSRLGDFSLFRSGRLIRISTAHKFQSVSPDKPDKNLAVIINSDPIIIIQERQIPAGSLFNERENPLQTKAFSTDLLYCFSQVALAQNIKDFLRIRRLGVRVPLSVFFPDGSIIF